VLIVDDEPAMLRALRINLRVRSYDVTTAATGRDALAEAGRPPPDAVILDRGLPDVDGIKVIGNCAAGPGHRSSCSPAGPGRATRSPPWTPAPTTTSPSRSPWKSSSPGCAPRSAATTRHRCRSR